DSLVTIPMQRRLEDLMVEHLYQDSVGTRVWVSKDERKAYYEQHKSQFFTYPTVQFAAFSRPTKAAADSLEEQLRSGVESRDLLRADSLAGRKTGSIQTRRQNASGPYQALLFEEMRPGDLRVVGPDERGVYAVIQHLALDTGRQLSFEESEQLIDETVQNMK